jgi:hypothetical protein
MGITRIKSLTILFLFILIALYLSGAESSFVGKQSQDKIPGEVNDKKTCDINGKWIWTIPLKDGTSLARFIWFVGNHGSGIYCYYSDYSKKSPFYNLEYIATSGIYSQDSDQLHLNENKKAIFINDNTLEEIDPGKPDNLLWKAKRFQSGSEIPVDLSGPGEIPHFMEWGNMLEAMDKIIPLAEEIMAGKTITGKSGLPILALTIPGEKHGKFAGISRKDPNAAVWYNCWTFDPELEASAMRLSDQTKSEWLVLIWEKERYCGYYKLEGAKKDELILAAPILQLIWDVKLANLTTGNVYKRKFTGTPSESFQKLLLEQNNAKEKGKKVLIMLSADLPPLFISPQEDLLGWMSDIFADEKNKIQGGDQ